MAGGETQDEFLARIDVASRRALFAQEEADLAAILKLYDQAERDLTAILYSMHQSLVVAQAEGDEQRVNYLQWKLEREEAFADQVRARLDRLRRDMTDRMASALRYQTERQAQYAAYGLDQATPPSVVIDTRSLTTEAVDAMVNTPWEGAMFSHRLWAFVDDEVREIQNVVGSGVLLGKGTDEIVRDVRDLRIGSSNAQPRYVLERLVRTEVLKASDRARERVYADNADVVEGEQVIATIDSRTDDGCAELDERQLGTSEADAIIEGYEFSQRPPFHPNCRCTTVPVMKSWKELLGLGEAPDDLEEIGPTDRVVRDPATGKSVLVQFTSFQQWLTTRSNG